MYPLDTDILSNSTQWFWINDGDSPTPPPKNKQGYVNGSCANVRTL